MHQLAIGVRDVGRGLGVLRAHPSLWKWLIAPAVISLALLVAAIAGILHVVDPLVGWVGAHLPSWLASVAGTVLHLVVLALLGIAGLFLFATVAGLIAGPFCEMLSEHVEAVLTGRPSSPFSLREFVHGALLGILHAIRRLIAVLLGTVLVFVIGFVPVVGTVAAIVLGFWLAGKAAAYDCYDAVLARRSMAYRDKLAYLAHYRGRSLGLGLAVAGMLLVPGVNLVALGIGAAGATVAAIEQRQDANSSSAKR
jgi:CysZ protein